jgi:hypothetical protein
MRSLHQPSGLDCSLSWTAAQAPRVFPFPDSQGNGILLQPYQVKKTNLKVGMLKQASIPSDVIEIIRGGNADKAFF